MKKLLKKILYAIGRIYWRTVCIFKGHVWYPPKYYQGLWTYYCLRCVKIVKECPHKERSTEE